MKMLRLRIYDDEGGQVSGMSTPVPKGAFVVAMEAAVVYSTGRRSTVRLMLWNDIEQIAAYVRGDGTDAQRVALADGILEGRRDS